MDLILWRHAQAEDGVLKDPFDVEGDLARRLTRKGERQAERMAAWLNAHLPVSTRVLVSPAQRTQQTAQALGRPFTTVDALSPQARVDALLAAAQWPHAPDPVLIVGHQPTLGMLAARLLGGQDLRWSVKKGGVWWLSGRMRDDQLEVTLQTVLAPDLL